MRIKDYLNCVLQNDVDESLMVLTVDMRDPEKTSYLFLDEYGNLHEADEDSFEKGYVTIIERCNSFAAAVYSMGYQAVRKTIDSETSRKVERVAFNDILERVKKL